MGLGLLSHAVHWCVTHCRQLSAVSYEPLSHSRHNAGDKSTKVGHAIMVKFSLARAECITLTLSLGVIPVNIVINDIPLKTRFLAQVLGSDGIIFTSLSYASLRVFVVSVCIN